MKEKHTKYHKDGTVWAKGELLDGQMNGYWEWFRVDGTIMRSGHFAKDKQVGEWVTYDKKGQPHKITQFGKKEQQWGHSTLLDNI